MKCQRYGGTAMRKIGRGLLACASVVAALTAAGPAAEATRTPGRETPRHHESGLRPTRTERDTEGDAAPPALTASSSTTNRGTQQITINLANGGTGIQNAMCRGNRACDIAQALGTPYAGASPAPPPAPASQAPPTTRAATRAAAASRGRTATRAAAASRGGAATRAGAASRHAAATADRRGTGPQAAPSRGRAGSEDQGERGRR
ncbi:hypothetical protein SAMN05421833_103129 [Microbispora rosea]|uniref:Uncharacterized protein n=1 Tax=Microbispora rosea TaxID=58117 RepID=A0A1N6URG1_9ACTN|nr:hypothetical protein [Microbispora rosea]GIH46635.1 hypothetical protein Mro03_18140 [Microbispora rosea subsp. rosea]SIQ68218.1 hypothetical protein SAMN05421833_103129 [Microbispora rosea]